MEEAKKEVGLLRPSFCLLPAESDLLTPSSALAPVPESPFQTGSDSS